MRAFCFFLIAVAAVSCRFSKPPLSLPRWGGYVAVDSLTHHSTEVKLFYFFCLRNGVSIGGGSITKERSADGQLLTETVFKNTHAWVIDGHNRSYSKHSVYDSTGQCQRIDYRISQNYGIGSSDLYTDSLLLPK